VLALRALDRPSAVNRAYFLSQGEPVRLWPWINEVLAAVGVAPLEKRISFRAAYRIGAVAEGLWSVLRLRGVPPMTRFVATELAKDHWFSIEAARRELGYQPEAFPTAEGIARYAEAWGNGTTPRF
ncbi:MAG: 3-beta hydroxysteroid dehydrogenase, partial [Verrucomicrobia bacterium]|nr:3-beta hydroxysteroid dehydrogenase [Verrucomicrobiota bacterium]